MRVKITVCLLLWITCFGMLFSGVTSNDGNEHRLDYRCAGQQNSHYIHEDILRYCGPINSILYDILEKERGGYSKAWISSGGGNIAAAIDIVDLLRRENKYLIISQICASACANFLFAGSEEVKIRGDTIVLFHHTSSTALQRVASSRYLEKEKFLQYNKTYAEPETQFYEAFSLDKAWLYEPDLITKPICMRSIDVKDEGEAPILHFENEYDYWMPPQKMLKKLNSNFEIEWGRVNEETLLHESKYHQLLGENSVYFSETIEFVHTETDFANLARLPECEN